MLGLVGGALVGWQGHVIVCGLADVGLRIVEQLALSGVANPQGADALAAVLDAEFKKWPLLLPKLGIHME